MALHNPSSPEQHYYDLAVAETAERVAKVSPDKADDVADLIEEAYQRDIDDLAKKRAFTTEVLKRASDLRKKAASEKEATILDKYQGTLLELANGTGIDDLGHAGVEKEFKFTIGPWYKRAWQILDDNKVDRTTLNTWISELQDYEKQVEANRVRLEMYKASRDSMKSAKALTKAVVAVVTSQPKATLKALVNQYLAAREQVHQLEKTIAQQEKAMAKKKIKIEQAMAEVEKKRAKGRELFDTMFKPRLDVLIANKTKLPEREYQDEMAAIRQDVGLFGDKAGIIYFEYFLNEALKIKPVLHVGTPAYEGPKTEIDKARETALVSRWWKEVLGVEASASSAQQLISTLRKDQPAMLTKIVEKQVPDQTKTVLQFLLTGFIGGKRVLESRRMLKATPQEVARILESSDLYESSFDMNQVLQTFANHWQEYDSRDFETAFHMIEGGQPLPPNATQKPVSREKSDVDKRVDAIFPVTANGNNPHNQDKYHAFFQKHPDLHHMIFDDETAQKLSFLVDGIYASVIPSVPQLHIKDTSLHLSLLNADEVTALLRKSLKVIHELDSATFSREADAFFKGPKADSGMKGFAAHLVKEYS